MEHSLNGEPLAMATARVCIVAMMGLAACTDAPAAGPSLEADTSSSGGAAADGGAASSTAGLAKACVSNAECTPYGLTCYVLSPNLRICSRGCQSSNDCGAGTFCNPLSGALVCTPPGLCDRCKNADECGPDAPVCANTGKGDGFCTRQCTAGKGQCGAGYTCVQYGTKVSEFGCRPLSGSCFGDGEQCSPCKADADCKVGAACFQAKDGAERFCAERCEPQLSSVQCPLGFGCAAYGNAGFCFQRVATDTGAKLLATCAAGAKGFCDACADDWECASGRCATKEGKTFCASAKVCNKDTEAADCPYGGVATFCVPSNKGNICAPPIAQHCHGYKACLTHPCGADERCDNGVCKVK